MQLTYTHTSTCKYISVIAFFWLTSQKKRSFGKDLKNSACSASKTWEKFPLISDDEEFSLVSNDDEEPLSPSQLMDKKDPATAELNDGPSSLSSAEAPHGKFLNNGRARRERWEEGKGGSLCQIMYPKWHWISEGNWC